MCGILCYLNPQNKNLHENVLKGLVELQNRGKDSCGVFTANNPMIGNFIKDLEL